MAGIYLAALIIFLTKKKNKREGKRNSTTLNCKQFKRSSYSYTVKN